MSRRHMAEIDSDLFKKEYKRIMETHHFTMAQLANIVAPHSKSPGSYLSDCARSGKAPTEVLEAMTDLFQMDPHVSKSYEEPKAEKIQLFDQGQQPIIERLDRIIKILENISLNMSAACAHVPKEADE